MNESEIKIYLQKPWKKSDSPYYLYLRETPPKNVNFVNSKEFKLIENKNVFKINNFIKQSIKKIIKLTPNLPNAHFTPKNKKYDLIHCAHCLSLNKSPWVTDIEFLNQFWACQKRGKRDKVLKLLMSKYCKKIMPWTEWCKKDILRLFPEIKDKVKTVYPAVPVQKFKREREHEKVTLLFSSRRFYFKGGLHALEVIDRLTKKHKNVFGIIISDTPKDILNKYSKNKKIKFYSVVTKEKLFKEIYPNVDIFVYPSYTDTLGFGILEAMSFGLPVVSVDGQSRRELIENGKTGFVIENMNDLNKEDRENLNCENLLSKIEEKTEELIKDETLRIKMSVKALNEIKEGKFSIKERNKKLEQIYLKECLIFTRK